MRTDRRIHFKHVILVLVVIIGIFFWLSREPHYKGKSYRAWLDQYISSVADSKAQIEAKQAILHIGTKAIPTLLSMMAASDSVAKKFIIARINNRWAERAGVRGFLWRYCQRSTSDPVIAAVGFPLLGPAVSNTVPGLTRIVRTSHNPRGIESAIQCLRFIGPPARAALPDLVNELEDTTHLQKYEGMFTVSLRVEAIASIACENGKWQPDCLRILLPALTDALKETNVATSRILMMLEKIGPGAKSAVPAIQPFLTSTNSDISSRAERAIKAIDPATAHKPTIQ